MSDSDLTHPGVAAAANTGHDGLHPTTAPPSPSIGAGVSGLTAAYLLQRTHHVTLFEADERIGGHAHTHDVEIGGGTTVPVDSGLHRAQRPHLPDRCGGCSTSSACGPGRPR